MVRRVAYLFYDYPELVIQGFNTFLPPGYHIEAQSSDCVNLNAPAGVVMQIKSSGTDASEQGPNVLPS